MRVVVFLTEPAAYTLDLVRDVHKKLNIKYRFLQTKTLISKKGFDDSKEIVLNKMSLFKRYNFLLSDYNKSNIIIFNGYNRLDFILLFFGIHIFKINKKVIILESDTQLVIPKNVLKRFIKYVYLKIVFSNKHVYAGAGGKFVHRDLFRYYGMDEERIKFFPMVIDVKRFQKSVKKSDFFSFLFVGRLIQIKNIELLIKSFLLNFKDNPKVFLKIAGNGPLLNYLKSKYKFKNIIFLGKINNMDINNVYNDCNVVVLPSTFEPWGLVVNEAMASGLPVIVSDKVGARYDLILNRETGFVFKSGDLIDLSDKMLMIYENKSLYNKLSANSFKLLQNYWNLNLYKQQVKSFIDEIETKV